MVFSGDHHQNRLADIRRTVGSKQACCTKMLILYQSVKDKPVFIEVIVQGSSRVAAPLWLSCNGRPSSSTPSSLSSPGSEPSLNMFASFFLGVQAWIKAIVSATALVPTVLALYIRGVSFAGV